jgi:hypothetical protein
MHRSRNAAPSEPEPLTIPVGICGRLTQPAERDEFAIAGTQGQTVRIMARTRSLGSPTLLRMQLANPSGQIVAESPVQDADEWSMDVSFAETGHYRLMVSDLLQRGGPTFAYWLEIVPAGRFAIAIKGDANTPETRRMETGVGATFVDLTIQRFGYDGPIQLDLVAPPAGLRIVNPVVPASVAEHRMVLVGDATWDPNTRYAVRCIAKGVSDAAPPSTVNSLALRRAKTPHQPFPPQWSDGRLFLNGLPAGAPFFALEHPPTIALANVAQPQSFSVNFKRLVPEFQEPIVVLSTQAPEGWAVQTQLDKDTLQCTLSRSPEAMADASPKSISVTAFGSFRVGRIESFSIPVSWYEPLKIELSAPATRPSQERRFP